MCQYMKWDLIASHVPTLVFPHVRVLAICLTLHVVAVRPATMSNGTMYTAVQEHLSILDNFQDSPP